VQNVVQTAKTDDEQIRPDENQRTEDFQRINANF